MKSDAPLHSRNSGHPGDAIQQLEHNPAQLAAALRLLQTQKFLALNALAGGVAHEFNNIIAGILGSAELLAMDLPEGHPAHETLRQVFEASNHGRDFVHKLRAFSLRPALEFKLIQLGPVIEESVQILRTIIPAKVELHVRISSGCPRVNADSAQIHQAVLDLCIHSWQGLADRRGNITITLESCPAVRLPAGATSLLQPGPHLCLRVQDDSPGLEKSARENIFNPFRSRRSGGSKIGLELFLVRETVQAHQGEIFLESHPGGGQTFLIYLPVAEEK